MANVPNGNGPGPMFVTDREINFVNTINKELIQHVVGQWVNYYAMSLKHTRVDDLYNEAVQKVWLPPVQITARVLWDSPTVTSTPQGQDTKYEAEVYFHNQELTERNVLPKEGDYVEFGQVFFEITSVTEPQLVFGQVNNRMMKKCVCVPSREGQFQNGNKDSENVDNSHPVQQVIGEEI